MSALAPDQVALIAAVADRPRTPTELAVTVAGKTADIEAQLRSLRKLGLVEARMAKCPLCLHFFGGRVYEPTEQGLLVLAASPLVRNAMRRDQGRPGDQGGTT